MHPGGGPSRPVRPRPPKREEHTAAAAPRQFFLDARLCSGAGERVGCGRGVTSPAGSPEARRRENPGLEKKRPFQQVQKLSES